jgi:hypothetical protein
MNMEQKPDFNAMTRPQHLAWYNSVSSTKRKAAFSTKQDGVKRCEAEWARLNPPTKTKKAKNGNGAAHATRQPRNGEKTIKILTEGKANPRREGTISYDRFEAMKKFPKVGDYLDQYSENAWLRNDARRWLSNAVRDGYVEVK